jgi:hypothetical protein
MMARINPEELAQIEEEMMREIVRGQSRLDRSCQNRESSPKQAEGHQ